MIFLFLILAGLAGWLYRRGGTNKGTLWRDLGVPIVATISLLLLGIRGPWWAYFLHFGLLFGALTTYHKYLNPFFGKPTTDCFWFNWLATGLCYGLAAIPLSTCGVYLWLIGLRTIVLAVATMIWSELIDDVDWEEGGRGGAIIISLLILGLWTPGGN